MSRRSGARAAVLAADAYLVALVAAAAVARGRPAPRPPTAGTATQLVVIVPAHDEEQVLGETLRSLFACEYPAERRRVVVVADNCTDATAAVAAAEGAIVWERHDPSHRGKGYAVAWALERLRVEGAEHDAVVLVDADCVASPNLLAAVDSRLRDGARVVQVRYDVSNPEASPTTALRWAAFALMNTVRPMGRAQLGLSAGLFGTGMAFTTGVLDAVPWEAFSLAEDAELHHRLVAAGERVTFAPEASVRSPMPVTREDSEQQQARWEAGRWQLIGLSVPRLVRAAVARRDVAPLVTAAELVLVPPQSVLAAANVLAVVGAVMRRSRSTGPAVLGAASQAVYVVGGLVVAGAPSSVWRALASAPGLVAWKLWMQVRVIVRPPRGWVRTTRPSS